MDIKPKTYVFTVRFKNLFDNDWNFKNVIIEDCVAVKSALKKMRAMFSEGTVVIVDNIYSEES
jgi:hypothetical protein